MENGVGVGRPEPGPQPSGSRLGDPARLCHGTESPSLGFPICEPGRSASHGLLGVSGEGPDRKPQKASKKCQFSQVLGLWRQP